MLLLSAMSTVCHQRPPINQTTTPPNQSIKHGLPSTTNESINHAIRHPMSNLTQHVIRLPRLSVARYWQLKSKLPAGWGGSVPNIASETRGPCGWMDVK